MSEHTGAGLAMISAVGIAARGGRIYTSDLGQRAVIAADPDSGERALVSGRGLGAGPHFVAPFDLDLEADGSVVVVDPGRMAVLRVDPATGDRALVSDLADPRLGPVAVNPLSILRAGDGRLMVLDRYLRVILAVDPDSGARRIFSGRTQGVPMKSPLDLSLAADGDILVADPDARAIYRVDRGSGMRRLLACTRGEQAFGQGPAFHEPVGVLELDDGDFLVGDLGGQEVLRLTPGGDRRRWSGQGAGQGPRIELLMAITRDERGRVFYVERLNDAIVEVLPGGDRREVSAAASDHVSTFLQPYDITRDTGGNLLVMDRGRGAIVRVKARSGVAEVAVALGRTAAGEPVRSFGVDVLEDGTLLYPDYAEACVRRVSPAGRRSVLSGAGVGEGPEILYPGGIDHFPDGEILLVDAGRMAVLGIHPETGRRRVLSGPGVGRGPGFEKIFFVRAGPHGRIWIADMGRSALLVIDPVSGDRRVVSGLDERGRLVGDGPELSRPLGFDIDADGTLFVADFGRSAVLSIDPERGDRRIVSDNLSHPGEPLTMPTSVAIRSSRRLAVTDFTVAAVYWVDRITGRRSLLAADR